MEITAESVNKVAKDLTELIEAAKLLYFSDKDISPALADALDDMWDLSQDYIEMYENYSRQQL